LRIWSAGCATGEEPYTIAILLSRLIPDIHKWQITLLATDINPRSLERAAEGIYREWSFRGDFQWLKDAYFTRTLDGRYRIAEKIRKMVTFHYLNLATDSYPSLFNNTNAMDIIFCRNVLMYLEPSLAKQVVRHFYRALVDEGWVLTSVTEGFHLLSSRFAAVAFPGVTLYQKKVNQEGTLDTFRSLMHGDQPAAREPRNEGGKGLSALRVTEKPPREDASEGQPDAARGASALPAISPPAPAAEGKTEAALYEQALQLFKGGRVQESESILNSFLERKPENFQGQALMARLYADQGRLHDAQAQCERALALNKLDAGCHYLLAAIFIEQRHFSEAEQALRRALYLEPDFVLAHFSLGNLAREEGRDSLAARHFDQALRLLQQSYSPEDLLPESDGVTAGRMKEIILMANRQRFMAPGA